MISIIRTKIKFNEIISCCKKKSRYLNNLPKFIYETI